VFYYLAAMLAKTSTVMLPLVLLLYRWWKRGTITWQDVKRTLPYVVIAVVMGLVTIHFQNRGHEAFKMGSYFSRLLGAGMAACFYLGKFLWPTELLPIYPGWTLDTPTLVQVLPIPLLAVLFFGLWTQRRSWGRHVLFGLGFFLLNLLPVLGFLKMEYLTISPVADRFVYLPMIGLIGLVVAVFGLAEKRLARAFRPVGVGIVTAIFALMAWESHSYAGMFINQETLWTYTLQRNPGTWIAHNSLGLCLQKSGRLAEAMEQYDEALQIKPDYAEAHNNLGSDLLHAGRLAEAENQFKQALQINPDLAAAYNNLGYALQQSGRIAEAIECYEEALQINPNYIEAHNDLGNALLQTGRAAEAIEQYQEALQLNPDLAEAYYDLGNALEQSGRMAEAIQQYQEALQLNPDFTEAHYNLGNALEQSGRMAEAIQQYQEVLRLKPDDAEAYANMGAALQQTGRISEAITQYEQALRLKPDDAAARSNLAQVQALQQAAPAKK
jgi:tetratricopeptide (TPR) repeat protein